MNFRRTVSGWWLGLALGACALTSVHAVLVAGAHGGPGTANNTTRSQLEMTLKAGAGYFDNVVAYSDAGAVYLGYTLTAAGPKAYALTAWHITPAPTITIQGRVYNVKRTQIANSDVALLSLSRLDSRVPTLPGVRIASTTPPPGTDVVMIGFGNERVQPATTRADVPDAVAFSGKLFGYSTTSKRVKRWGINSTVLINGSVTVQAAVSGMTNVAATRFSQPGPRDWLTSNEAQAVLGDSGGGVFTTNGTLVGLLSTISGKNPQQAYFGEASYFSNIAVYKPAIEAAIGYPLQP